MFGFKSEPRGEGETDWCASIGMSKPRPKKKKKKKLRREREDDRG